MKTFTAIRGALTAIALVTAPTLALGQSQFDQAMSAAEAGEHARAVSLFLDAAHSGDEAAQFNLSVLYARGQGTPQNDQSAFYWAWRARLAGETRAATLTEFLDDRLSPEIRAIVAEQLLADVENLAEQGDVAAFLSLGRLNMTLLEPRDRTQALAWFMISAAFNVEYGAALRDALSMELDTETRAEAQARARVMFVDWCDRLPSSARIESCDAADS